MEKNPKKGCQFLLLNLIKELERNKKPLYTMADHGFKMLFFFYL
jgi:G:T-mismatch repair DNA endonuclease (very short patch repair protein)